VIGTGRKANALLDERSQCAARLSMRMLWQRHLKNAGSPEQLWTSLKKSRCLPIRRSLSRKLKIVAACFITLPARGASRGSPPILTKEWPDAAFKGMLDVLEGNYGGDKTRMPYVVNKEAWRGSGADGEGI
jgi:hypothetical protein